MITAVDAATFAFGLVSATAVILATIATLVKLLWSLSAKWTKVGDEIQDLGEEIKNLVLLKERDHSRIEAENLELKRRIERHEQWHFDRRKNGEA